MPYTNDPQNIPTDRVRFLLGDTSSSPDLTDPEIVYLLETEGADDPLRAAARGAELLASRFTAAVEEKRVGPLLIKTAQNKAIRYMQLATRLWARVLSTSGRPFAGGISVVDKDARRLDSDRVRPAFSRRMMRYPDTATPTVSSDRLLGGEGLE